MEDIATGQSSLLKNVTAGYHYHTVTADREEVLDVIEAGLREHGFLAPLQAFEPDGIRR
jgi:transcriptional regulator of NAD metabolism